MNRFKESLRLGAIFTVVLSFISILAVGVLIDFDGRPGIHNTKFWLTSAGVGLAILALLVFAFRYNILYYRQRFAEHESDPVDYGLFIAFALGILGSAYGWLILK